MNKSIGVITNGSSDLLSILEKQDIDIVVISEGDISKTDLLSFDALAIIGGSGDDPIVLHPRDNIEIEEYLATGKRFFSEFCRNPSHILSSLPKSTMKERLVLCSDELENTELYDGDILDDQANSRLMVCNSILLGRPMLQYAKYVMAHSHIGETKTISEKISDRALWFEADNFLFCAFRMADFNKARFAPKVRWRALVRYVLEWLCEVEVSFDGIEDAYCVKPLKAKERYEDRLKQAIDKGIGWFHQNELFCIREGKYDGVKEGLSSIVLPDGRQELNPDLRGDCAGETSFAFSLYHMLRGDSRSLKISDDLLSFCFETLQVKDHPICKGMLRFTGTQRDVCYQDDNSRGVIIPALLKNLYSGRNDHIGEIVAALRFLLSHTGTNGIRTPRTEGLQLTEEMIKKLSGEVCDFNCAHFNATYSAALLLTYKMTGLEEFKPAGIKGLESIMQVYPETIREHSETQELCRLITPLSFLYWITGSKEHKDWLYKVVKDLQRFKHPSGAYLEWDTGYKASRSRKIDSECSLLNENGDPVADLLYSINWLPTGFMQAYFVTKDSYFKELWNEVARFFISSQIHSSNRVIDGAWARAFDVEFNEVFGSPYDEGWAHWTVETGWTMAEILSGLIMGLLSEELSDRYKM